MAARTNDDTDIRLVELAIGSLRNARALLTAAGAGRSADKVRKAIKSAEGALRHTQAVVDRIARGDR